MARPYLCTGVAHVVIGSLCVAAGVTFAVLLSVYPGEQSSDSGSGPSRNASADKPTNFMASLRDQHLEWAGFLACSKIWCGFWFVVTGAVGVSVRQKGCMESAYLALSILNILVWAPVAMAVNGFIAYFGIFFLLFALPFYWLLLFPAIGVLFGLIEFILSIVSSSIVCCCSRDLTPSNHLAPTIYQYEMKVDA